MVERGAMRTGWWVRGGRSTLLCLWKPGRIVGRRVPMGASGASRNNRSIGKTARELESDGQRLLSQRCRSTSMELMTKQNRFGALELLILGLCVTLASSAVAEEKIVKPTDVPATVVAHLPLPQATGSQ